jgi:hypothetical protein
MLRDIDNFFLNQPEPLKSSLIFLRKHILDFNTNLTEAWKYRMPFYCYKGKMLCYLWVDKKTAQPYIGIVDGNKIEHPLLVMDKRARMKIMMLNADMDLPIEFINEILKIALDIRKN